MAKKVLSIQTGIWWTKVALIEYGVKHPQVYDMFTFRTPEHAIEDGYIRERESLANQLRAELSKRKIGERKVVFSINSAKVVAREVTIPKVKDRQLKSVALEQARENFPMDITSYTISYAKMGMLDGDPKQQMKLLLLAVPDNLLTNYVSFAELCGLEIETFEYMGNCAMQFIAKNYIEDSVIVQLEERSTIVSVVKDNKLVFQRVAPHGFDTTLATAIDHPVLGLREDIEAFEFLCKNNVTRDRAKPEMFDDSVIVDPEERMAAVNQAYEAIKESMDYHVRIVVSALEFYQNQYKTPLRGTLHLIGDGMRIQGMTRYFDTKINIEVEKNDYLSLVKMDKRVSGNIASNESVGLLSIIGAAIDPMSIMPKELMEQANKKNSTKNASMLVFASLVIGAGLIAAGGIRKTAAVAEQNRLQKRIEELQYIEEVYKDNQVMQRIASGYREYDSLSKSQNERMGKLVEDLEAVLPTTVTVQTISGAEEKLTINLISDEKLTIAQLIMNLKELKYLNNVFVPSIAEMTDDEGNSLGWNFSVTATYVTPEDEKENTNTEGIEVSN